MGGNSVEVQILSSALARSTLRNTVHTTGYVRRLVKAPVITVAVLAADAGDQQVFNGLLMNSELTV